MAGRGEGADFVESLARGLDVLQCFSAERPRMSLSEVAAVSGLARPTARRLLLTLEELGFEVREAGNGKEALSVLASEKKPITLSLLDWNMPVMDGFELLQRVRDIPELNSMVIIMVTAETELERISDALDAGANEYVMKPFTKDVLVGKLELAGIYL